MNKISFICMCASEATRTIPNKGTITFTALKEGFSLEEANHLYQCCMSIYRSK